MSCHEEHRIERILDAYAWLAFTSIVFAVDVVRFARESTVTRGLLMVLCFAIALLFLRRVTVNHRTLRDGTCPCKADVD